MLTSSISFFGITVGVKSHSGSTWGLQSLRDLKDNPPYLVVERDGSVWGTHLLLLNAFLALITTLAFLLVMLWRIPKKVGFTSILLADLIWVPLQHLSNVLLLPVRLLVVILGHFSLLGYLVGILDKIAFLYLVSQVVSMPEIFNSLVDFLVNLDVRVWIALLVISLLPVFSYRFLKSLLLALSDVFLSINGKGSIRDMLYVGLPTSKENLGVVDLSGEPEDGLDELFEPLGTEQHYDDSYGVFLNNEKVRRGLYKEAETLKGGKLLFKGKKVEDIKLDDDYLVLPSSVRNFLEVVFPTLDSEDRWEVFVYLYSVLIDKYPQNSAFVGLSNTLEWSYGYKVLEAPKFLALVSRGVEDEQEG